MQITILLIILVVMLITLAVLMGHLYTAVRYVPFVPTQERVVDMMIDVAQLQDGQTVVDLGCGDGRILLKALKDKQVKAIGIEGSWMVYMLARLRRWFSKKSYQLFHQDFFESSLEKADVVFCYLFPHVMEKLAPKFQEELQPGSKIVSYSFPLKGWEPVKVLQTRVNKPKNFLLFVYEVPKSYESID